MSEQQYDKVAVLSLFNRILELELAGVVRYTHYSFMVSVTTGSRSSPGCAAKRRSP